MGELVPARAGRAAGRGGRRWPPPRCAGCPGSPGPAESRPAGSSCWIMT